MSVNAALVRFIYPGKILGRGIALNGLVIALGVALGPTVAAGVLSVATWEWLLPHQSAAWRRSVLFRHDRASRDTAHSRRIRLSQYRFTAAGLGSLVIGLDSFAHSSGVFFTLALLVVGSISMFTLVRLQLRRLNPLLPVDLLLRPEFRMAFITGFLGFVASNFFIISIPFDLMDVLHRGPVATGLLITPWPLAIVLVAPFVGRLTDRYPRRVIVDDWALHHRRRVFSSSHHAGSTFGSRHCLAHRHRRRRLWPLSAAQ